MSTDPFAEGALFDMAVPPPVSLADRFGVPPITNWDMAQGPWRQRKRKWLGLGIESEVGRDAGLTFDFGTGFMQEETEKYGHTTSIFDPVTCELSYRWFSKVGDHVLDPFAGGSVRGVVAGVLGRHYTGVDLRAEQVASNWTQRHIVGDNEGTGTVSWVEGDATDLPFELRGHKYDFILSCPPYADLEVYSDDPRDLSTMSYTEFTHAHHLAIAGATQLLAQDRFCVWVISDVRDKHGNYRGLVADTIKAFQDVGMNFYNDIILREPIGTARLRSPRLFNLTRKVARTHQHALVFVKGDGKAAARRLDPIDPRLLDALGAADEPVELPE